MLQGTPPVACSACHVMEQHHKTSGRQRQLLKIGVQESQFAKTMLSSPMLPDLKRSADCQGSTERTVSDWQIDLGNFCNSACIFCNPESSSKLASEFKRIGLIDQVPAASWCENPELLSRFVDDLKQCQDIRYLHFIGGETLITPGFVKILEAVIAAGRAQDITVGFTTNLTVWDDHVIDLLTQFHQVNLGMSVEALDPINDYVRWPGVLSTTRELLDRWVAVAQAHDWLIQLRITPTCLTIHRLSTVYDYAWQHELAVESCNFLNDPEFMRISVLPTETRSRIRDQLQAWIDQHPVDSDSQVINTRDPHRAREQIVQDAASYVHLLTHTQDESHRLLDLVNYLKRLEASRGNSILNYIPEYESFLRSAGL
jgi:sulfatase maturation enzyme AslB (radical SAM superfamily)